MSILRIQGKQIQFFMLKENNSLGCIGRYICLLTKSLNYDFVWQQSFLIPLGTIYCSFPRRFRFQIIVNSISFARHIF